MEVTSSLNISSAELSFTFSRSSGPGGQNVNKVNTRVTLSFDVLRSASLNDRQRQRIFSRLAGRVNKDGVLRIAADSHRTQQANKEEATRRFIDLLRGALHEQRPRRKTKLPRRAKERRLSAKKNRGRLKKLRRGRVSENE